MTFPVFITRSSDDRGGDRFFPRVRGSAAGTPGPAMPEPPASLSGSSLSGSSLSRGALSGTALSGPVVELDGADGPATGPGGPARVGVRRVVVREAGPRGSRTVTVVEDPTELLLTAARVVFSPRRPPPVRAGQRRRARVGHVRYAWLDAVGASPRMRWLDGEQVRLVLRERQAGGTTEILVDVTLDRGGDSIGLAGLVAARAARWRTAHDRTLSAGQAAQAAGLLEPPLLIASPPDFAFHVLPAAHPVGTLQPGVVPLPRAIDTRGTDTRTGATGGRPHRGQVVDGHHGPVANATRIRA